MERRTFLLIVIPLILFFLSRGGTPTVALEFGETLSSPSGPSFTSSFVRGVTGQRELNFGEMFLGKIQELFTLGIAKEEVSVRINAATEESAVVATIPRATHSLTTEQVGGSDAHIITIDAPGEIPDYKYQFLTNGLRLFIDRQDGNGWVQLISEIRTAPEYMKQQGAPGNFVWNPYGLNISTAGATVLQGYDRQDQGDGSTTFLRTYQTFEEGIEETLTETWTIPKTTRDLAANGPKVTYSMTQNRGIVDDGGVLEGTWRMKWEFSGIADITADNSNIVDSDGWPIRKKRYSNGEFAIDVNDFDNVQNSSGAFTFSEIGANNKAEILFFPNGTTGERLIDPTIVTTNVATGWKHNKQRNVFFNGENFFVFYNKGSTSLFAKGASTVAGLPGAPEQTVLNTTMVSNTEWDIYVVNDLKFDLVYFDTTTTAVVQTCEMSAGSTTITCDSASATVSFSAASSDSISVTRTPSADRIWIVGRRGANTRVYSANQTDDSNNITTWTEEVGGTDDKNGANQTTVIPYNDTDEILFIYQRDPGGSNSDGIYSRDVVRSTPGESSVSLALGGVQDDVLRFGNGVRISDTDFRFIYINTASDVIEAKWDDSTWDATFETVHTGTDKNPALMLNRNNGDLYAIYADSADDIFYHRKKGGSWEGQTDADNDESDANSLPVLQMHESAYGVSRGTPMKLVWGYLNAASGNFDIVVGSRDISPEFEQSTYRWFTNQDNTDVGSPLAAQDTAATLATSGTGFRLRMLLHMSGGLVLSGANLKLQFADKGGDANCSDVASGNFADVTTSTAIAYNDNATPLDGNALTANANDPLHAVHSGSFWTEATSAANWGVRSSHTSVVFNDGTNKMWVIGGAAPTISNDVWYSTDGITWTQATANANWAARHLHTSVVFNDGTNKMWVIGGAAGTLQNDVWYSTDGITWTQATASANWEARDSHSSVVFNDGTNKMWVMGGFTTSAVNDVWYSTDGITWTQATANANWGARFDLTSVVFNDGTNKMWVIGGFTTDEVNDVWYSTDGITWTEATANANWAARENHTSVVFDDGTNKMWVIGGSTGSRQNDVWYTPSTINQTYEELNPFTNSGAAISDGTDGMWDFSLYDNGAPGGTTYCTRAILNDGTELDTYTQYPEITTAAAVGGAAAAVLRNFFWILE